MGTSPGAIGTALAQAHLRNILLALDVRLMGQPEVYVQLRPESISEDLAVSEESLRNLLERHITAFEALIDRVKPTKGQ
jgi:chromate reductase